MPQNVNFTMDDGLQQEQWKRQQAMADMLRQQSMEPLETNQMAGGYVIPTPKLAGVNKIAQALMAGYQDNKIAGERKDYAADQNAKMVSGLEGYQKALQGTPATPYQADNAFGEDLGTLTNAAVPGSKQAAMAALLNSGSVPLQQTGMQASLAQMLKEPTPEKWGNEPRYDQTGRAFLTSDQGNLRYLDGVNARDKLVSEDTGGQKVFRTEYSPDAVGMLAKTATPDAFITDSRARSEGAANRGVTMRGQDVSAGSAAAGRAVTMRGQNLSASAAKERIAAGKGNVKNMSATMQKELFEADDTVQSGRNVIGILNGALKINKDAYSGYGAKQRAVLRSNLPGQSEAADATINLDNMMTGQALESLKLVFGGMPTEGERKILLEMQASADKTPGQRKSIIERGIAAANNRVKFNASKAKSLRGGTYLTDAPEPAGATFMGFE